jgi:exopolysaccharide/PEP-CTERM locus tyrosine autokinase
LVLERLRNSAMLVPGSRLAPSFSDEYRRIKRPLLSNVFGKTASLVDRGNLILVTSSLPGEGKTHTAVNLALSIAQEQDHTVLLLDCDVAKKGASRMLGIDHLPGLMDVLDTKLPLAEVLLRTDIPALRVVAAGRDHEHATELLASQYTATLVDEIASRYSDRVVILDGPPVLPTPQTHVLAELVGQIVFVVEAGKTAQSVIQEALELLPAGKAIGLVLNKSESSSGGHGYYYGYYGSNADQKP